MMLTVHLLIILIALACFLGAAVGWPVSRVNLIGLGLFCWLLATVVNV